jgi:hypothetical protein
VKTIVVGMDDSNLLGPGWLLINAQMHTSAGDTELVETAAPTARSCLDPQGAWRGQSQPGQPGRGDQP